MECRRAVPCRTIATDSYSAAITPPKQCELFGACFAECRIVRGLMRMSFVRGMRMLCFRSSHNDTLRLRLLAILDRSLSGSAAAAGLLCRSTTQCRVAVPRYSQRPTRQIRFALLWRINR
jgi:hypothetical protein